MEQTSKIGDYITVPNSATGEETMVRLIHKKCDDGGDVPTITARRAKMLLKELQLGWKITGKGHLKRRYLVKDFAAALAFANKVGAVAVAEAEGHHPDLYLAWGTCTIEIWSHKVKGLTESDFVLAATNARWVIS